MKKTIAIVLMSIAMTAAATETIATRFGQLKTDEDDRELLYKGKSIVEGNNGIRLVKKFQIGDSDVLLIQDRGGNACASLYRFVAVTKTGGTVSKLFGSCDDLSNATQNGETIQVSIPGGKGKCAFEYKSGSVALSDKSPKKLCSVDVSSNESSKF